MDESLQWLNNSSARMVRKVIRIAACSLGFVFLPGLPACAQSFPANQVRIFHPDPNQQIGTNPDQQTHGDIDNSNMSEEQKRMQTLNIERQRALVSDTNKLVRLANELNDEISSANPETLTPSEYRKLAQIEKLAHGVKQKMSASLEGTPAYRPQPPAPMQ
jgi:hypothetical protein